MNSPNAVDLIKLLLPGWNDYDDSTMTMPMKMTITMIDYIDNDDGNVNEDVHDDSRNDDDDDDDDEERSPWKWQ